MSEERELATVELLGALTYAQLRAFEVSSQAIRVAPGARDADRVAEFARREYDAYLALRDHLTGMTDLGGSVIDRQKGPIDEFFDHVPTGESWVAAVTFFAFGLPLVRDFINGVAPVLDERTAQVVLEALGQRDAFAGYATATLDELIGDDEDVRQQVRHTVADLAGKALTQFQGAITSTDALEVLLDTGAEEADENRVRDMAIGVLEGHRRRMHELGIQEPD